MAALSHATASLKGVAPARACRVVRGPAARALPHLHQRVMGRPACYQRRCRQVAAPVYARVTGEPQGDLVSERSALVNREVVLLLFQLELDQQLQRALNYESFDAAQEIRARRQQVDEALRELQSAKGPGCGARLASNSDQVDLAPAILRLKMEMTQAVEEERYSDAAALRDQLRPLEDRSRAAAAEHSSMAAEPRFLLGQMVVHATKGYRAVVCGWDAACCEDEEWQAAASVSNPSQVFYHLLVDVRDWPRDEEQPPVAYVGESCLDAASGTDFSLKSPLNGAGLFQHPYSYLLFLGPDGKGNMMPCRQLRDKYSQQRRDVWSSSEEEEETTDEDDSEGGGKGGSPQGGGGGWPKIPGIDMSSLDD